jgi:predicted amidohydrolase
MPNPGHGRVEIQGEPPRQQHLPVDPGRFALVQLDTVAGEVAANVHKALHWTRRAFLQGVGWVFLHEGLTADYTAEPLQHARPLASSEVYGFAALCQKHGGYVALGLNELHDGQPYISTVFLGPDPAQPVLGVYRKSYLWPNPLSADNSGGFLDFLQSYVPHKQGYRLERGVLGAGDGTDVLDVAGRKLGCIICADASRDEAWATFENQAAELIFWQNNRNDVCQTGGGQFDPHRW